MIWILLALLSLGAPPDGARQASVERLRTMLDVRREGTPLNRDEVIAAIDDRHPRSLAAWRNIEAAEGEVQESLGAFEPVLSVGGKGLVGGYYGYVVGDAVVEWDAGPVQAWAGWRLGVDAGRAGLPDYHGEYQTLGGGEARLGASLDLLHGLARNADITQRRVAALGVDAARAQHEATRVLLRRDASVAWVKWVAAGRKLALEEALLDIARAREQAVQVRIELGDLSAIERVRNRQILAERSAAVAEARGALIAATERLSLYLRDESGRPIRAERSRLPARALPSGAPPAWEVDPILLAKTGHPGLIALRREVDARDQERRLARNGLLPDLSLGMEHARDLGSGDLGPDSLQRPTTQIGVKAEVPFLNWRDRGKSAAATAKADQAAAEFTWAEDRVVADVRMAMAREAAALAGWQAATETVGLALELQDGEQQRFDAGDIDLLRLWQVEQSTAQAISTEIEEWTRYQLAMADLEASIGVPIPPRDR